MNTVPKNLKQVDVNKLYTNTGDAHISLLNEDGTPSQYGYDNANLVNPGSIVLRDMGKTIYSNNNQTYIRKVQDVATGEVLYIPVVSQQVAVPTVENAIWIDGASNETIRNMTEDAQGNVYIVGYSNTGGFSVGGVTRPSVNNGTFVVKLTPQLTYTWVKWIDGTSNDQGYDISVDTNGNVYVTGYTNSSGLNLGGTIKPDSSVDGFIAKFDSSGIIQWGRFIRGSGANPNNEEGDGIAVDSQGNVYVTGFSAASQITVLGGSGTNYPKPTPSAPFNDTWHYILKLNTNGIDQWCRSIDSTADNEYPSYRIAKDSFDNIYISGRSYSNNLTITTLNGPVTRPTANDNSAVYVVKIRPNGDFDWASFIDGIEDELSFTIGVSPQNKVFVSGYSNTYGLTISTVNGTVTNPTNTSSYSNMFIVGYSTNGQILLARYLTCPETPIYSYGINFDSDSNIYVCGSCFNTTNNAVPISIQTASGKITATTGTDQIGVNYIIKYNMYGIPQWIRYMEGNDNGENQGYTYMISNKNGSLYVIGRTTLVGYTFIGPNGSYPRPSVNRGGFVVKYSQNTTVPSVNTFVVSN